MSRIAAVAPVLPDHVYPQQQITALLGPLIAREGESARLPVLERIHARSGVDTRHLALPLDRYPSLTSFTEANDAFVRLGTDLAERAARVALDDAHIRPDEVDLVVFTTITGVSAPSIDALLAARLGLRADVKRVPIFGLGCVAGASGIARVHDYLVGHPDEVALLVAVELCSLTLQHGDDSMANVVSSALFGDGAAAVVLVGERRARRDSLPGPDVVDTVSRLYPDTDGLLGWDVGGTGFRVVLAASLADVIEARLGDDVRTLLARHGLTTSDVSAWVAHTGGPRILDAAGRALGLDGHELDLSWASLARVGNLSSAGVLHVLADTLAGATPVPGSYGVLFAMGPGVSTEIVLLRWPEATDDLV